MNQPVVAVAVDEAERIERIVEHVDALLPSGLVTSERAWLLSDELQVDELPEVAHGSVKLTVYCGRAERYQGKRVFRALADHLRVCGVDGATVFLGVDGTLHGQRERAKFFSRNRDVPLMIISVGDAGAVLRALPGITRIADAPVITVEGIQVCKRDGVPLALPQFDGRADGDPYWRKLMIHAAGDTRVGGESLHYQLLEQLRRSGAGGATSLRGIWGYRGQATANGDSAWSLRRTSPVVTIVIDRDQQLAESWEAVDLLTSRDGLVTSELVPAHRAIVADLNEAAS